MLKPQDLIFEKSVVGRGGFRIPASDVAVKCEVPAKYRRAQDSELPEVSELEVVRHFTGLSKMNYCIDTNLYPLGSCTMKYNPRFTEEIAGFPGFVDLHPLLPQLKNGERYTQGALKVLFELEHWLCEITGMDAFTLQPLAGAHGELTGCMMIAAYHQAKGNNKTTILVPDSSHGTNPATAAIAGYEIVSVPSDRDGIMDMGALKARINSKVAGLMLTSPNTHGVFNPHLDEVARLIHEVDGLMYYDGANLNAVLGRWRPGDVGFDVAHVNLHKTFSTPHGGGGPGAGPVGVKKSLAEFLPISRVVKKADGSFYLNYDYPESIGYIASLYGNFGVLIKAYAYCLMLGADGLRETSGHAVLNANYLRVQLKDLFKMPFDYLCKHEFVLSASPQAQKGVHALDLAKFLIDKGIHPPTVYFPLTVPEAIMVEPTETESRQGLDRFVECMRAAAALAEKDPDAFQDMPRTTPVCRPDEVRAARELDTNYFRSP